MRRLLPTAPASLCLAVAIALAASSAPASEAQPLQVFAAASLADVVEELADGFEGARVVTSFGASSVLARQIRDGAPADVFLSASPEWMAFLAEADLLSGDATGFAGNRLVCITAPGSPLASERPGDAAALLAGLGPEGLIAVADEGVPAGEYARSALGQLGLLRDARGKLVGHKDVRAVLHAVERGQIDAGFVYETDARAGNVTLLFAFDPATHPPILYQGAVSREAPSPDAARRFLAHLHSEAARAILSRAGFAVR